MIGTGGAAGWSSRARAIGVGLVWLVSAAVGLVMWGAVFGWVVGLRVLAWLGVLP